MYRLQGEPKGLLMGQVLEVFFLTHGSGFPALAKDIDQREALTTLPCYISLVSLFQCMQEMGNGKANRLYEAYLPDGFRRPQLDQYPSPVSRRPCPADRKPWVVVWEGGRRASREAHLLRESSERDPSRVR